MLKHRELLFKMKHSIIKKIQIPQDIFCSYEFGILKCKKDSSELKKQISMGGADVRISDNEIIIEQKKGNKRNYKAIMSNMAHIKNMFSGLQEKFVYTLEAVSVHFPISLKIEKDKLVINNFLGEKTPRHAKILSDVDVDVKGQRIIVASSDKEAAGQTAANFEKATKIKARDKRIFQDGIYIVQKPERK